MKTSLEKLIQTRFPPLRFAFGYGSGVFQQANVKRSKDTMIDTIFAVDNTAKWHEHNIQRNPRDYSFIPRHLMSSSWIEWTQREIGGKMWFNTLIPCEIDNNKALMKYGVIDIKDLLLDLNEWETLYVAGRLQKPVLMLNPVSDEVSNGNKENIEMEQALDANYERALRTALIFLQSDGNSPFSANQLCEEIVGLSYGGDVRVGVAESPTKIRDIAAGSFNELCRIYLASSLGQKFIGKKTEDAYVAKLGFQELLVGLPPAFRVSKDENQLREKISSVIRSSSATQTLKGIFTAGFSKSLRYAAAKVAKRWGIKLG
jgi:translocator assembly and maintenance protein 41